MVLRNIKSKSSLWVLIGLVVGIVGIRNPVDVSGAQTQENRFVFTAHGDHGEYDNPETLLNFNAVAQTGAAFSLGLGDMNYADIGDEQRWCQTIQSVLGPSYPFEIVMGNHEDEDKVNGYIGNFVQYCPDRMNSQGIYGAEYYFDYPTASPLMRVIMIGAGNDWDWDADGTLEDDEYFDYDSSTPVRKAHLDWLIDKIDSARSSGVKWVVVGMHKNCLTLGEKSCEIGPELMDLLIAKKVDLILQGHDHNYQRSKQLSLGQGCSTIAIDSSDPDCVVNDGVDGVYAKGAGSIVIVTGHFGGGGFYAVSEDDSEVGYFAKAMGGNGWYDFLQSSESHSGVSRGFVKFEVSESQIIAEHVSTTNPTTAFEDNFSIVDTGITPTAVAVPSDTPTNTPTDEPTSAPTDMPTNTPTDAPTSAPTNMPTDMPTDAPASTPTPTQSAPDTLSPSNTPPLPTDGPTTLTLTTVADAYVHATSPDRNYGKNIALRTDASPDIRSYLRFDTQGMNVVRATLRIYANSASSTGFTVRDVTDNDWLESDLTHNNAPTMGRIVGSSGAFSAGTWTTVDVTSLVTDNGPVNLALTTTGSTAISYSSREGKNPPELVIDFFPAPPTPTLSPTEIPTTLSFTPVADAYVHATRPDRNYGSSVGLRMDASPDVRSYLRFDIQGVSGTVMRATLRVYAISASNTGFNVLRANENDWTESDLAYQNAPAIGLVMESSDAINAGTWTTVDITSLVTGNGQLSLALTTTGSRAIRFSSREGINPPELIIEFYPAP